MKKWIGTLFWGIGGLCWIILCIEIWQKLSPQSSLLGFSGVIAGLNMAIDLFKNASESYNK